MIPNTEITVFPDILKKTKKNIRRFRDDEIRRIDEN